jgi:hypothetical protein
MGSLVSFISQFAATDCQTFSDVELLRRATPCCAVLRDAIEDLLDAFGLESADSPLLRAQGKRLHARCAPRERDAVACRQLLLLDLRLKTHTGTGRRGAKAKNFLTAWPIMP